MPSSSRYCLVRVRSQYEVSFANGLIPTPTESANAADVPSTSAAGACATDAAQIAAPTTSTRTHLRPMPIAPLL
jgi:hypothetical protein